MATTAIQSQPLLRRVIGGITFYAYALFSLFLYLALSIQSGEYFRKSSEQDKLLYQISEVSPRYLLWNIR
jgi:hypothetical protein